MCINLKQNHFTLIKLKMQQPETPLTLSEPPRCHEGIHEVGPIRGLSVVARKLVALGHNPKETS